MIYSRPVSELVQARYSCRSYRSAPLPEEARGKLQGLFSSLTAGPFGTPLRLLLLASSDSEGENLRGLGTYGVIRNPAGFLVGVVSKGEMDMEDVGYALEQSVLLATDLDLGSCWLGGTYRRSNFAARAELRDGETMPAVVALGLIADRVRVVDRIFRAGAGSVSRRPWEELFFEGRPGVPLSRESAGEFAAVLDMVRRAPSASNKQPWRVVRSGDAWHFILQRTPGYRRGTSMAELPDLQRVDMGIAMCHFELTALQLGYRGRWDVSPAAIPAGGEGAEYRASWTAVSRTAKQD